MFILYNMFVLIFIIIVEIMPYAYYHRISQTVKLYTYVITKPK